MGESGRQEVAVRRRLSPFQISLRGMAVVVVCCAVVLWSWRRIRQEQHPAIQWVRALESRKVFERREAARFLLQSDPGDFEIARDALIGALKDEDLDVQGEAARSLGVVVSGMMRNGFSQEAIDPAVKAACRGSYSRRDPTCRCAGGPRLRLLYKRIHARAYFRSIPGRRRTNPSSAMPSRADWATRPGMQQVHSARSLRGLPGPKSP